MVGQWATFPNICRERALSAGNDKRLEELGLFCMENACTSEHSFTACKVSPNRKITMLVSV